MVNNLIETKEANITFNSLDKETKTVSARELHERLGLTERFNSWFGRMCEYGFSEESKDFCGCKVFNTLANQYIDDYNISIDMAKEICMIQRNEAGKRFRRYFIEVEKQWSQMVMSPMERLMRNSTNQLETATALVEILKVEAKKQEALTTEVKQLTSTVKTQNVQIAEMQPKVQYCDVVLNCPDLVTITIIAKDYGKSAIWMNTYLKDKKIIFKQGDIWLPYQKYAKLGLTKTKTSTYKDKDGKEHAKTHSYWTQKGRLFIYDLLKQDGYLPLIEQE